MNKYTTDEALLLAEALDESLKGHLNTQHTRMFMLFLKDDVNSALVTMVQESFTRHEDKMRMIDTIFQVKYEDLPLLINIDTAPIKHVIKWRLALNK